MMSSSENRLSVPRPSTASRGSVPRAAPAQLGTPVRDLAEEQFADLPVVRELLQNKEGMLVGYAESLIVEQVERLKHQQHLIANEQQCQRQQVNQALGVLKTTENQLQQISGYRNQLANAIQQIQIELQFECRRTAIEEAASRRTSDDIDQFPRPIRWVYCGYGFMKQWCQARFHLPRFRTHRSGVLRTPRRGQEWRLVSSLTRRPTTGQPSEKQIQLQNTLSQRRHELQTADQNFDRAQHSQQQEKQNITTQQRKLDRISRRNQQVHAILQTLRKAASQSELSYAGDGHLITFAPARSGKGTGVVIPNLLTYPGSTVVIDLKGTNYAVTARARRQLGQQVGLIDPFNLLEKMGVPSTVGGINPFDLIDIRNPECVDAARALAAAIVPPPAETSEVYLYDGAQELLVGFMLHVLHAENPNRHCLDSVRKLINQAGDDWNALLKKMSRSWKANGVIASSANSFLQQSENL
ncbi:MAG: type IV secretory system conjugative DNA transfer family protein, partial [Planctomycetaceae bacterium]|nr:type IV secretory system conjugative DNA transfer family protein [Planctomycetaceae bacterium]